VWSGLACLSALFVLSGCSPESDSDSRLNVILVVLDAARADHFGVYGYDRETTPAVDAFATEATRYETVISEAPYTFLAMSSLMSGGSPAVTGLVGRSGGIVPEALSLIAETAQKEGFATLGYSENPYVTRYFGLHQGFDVFEEAFPVSAHLERRELGVNFDHAGRLSRMLARASTESDGPFFLYLHVLRPHNPYAPPAPFAGRFGSDPADQRLGRTRALMALDERGGPFEPARLERIVALYDENLAFADALFGGLLEDLDLAGLRDETIVVLTSDHGEAFGEHGRLLHSTQLYDPMLRVPLLIRIPGHAAGVETTPIQLADLGRGLRAYFRSEAGSVAGLAELGRWRSGDEPLFSWTNAKTHLVSARTERRKLVIDAKTSTVVAYHDLLDDPGEKEPLPLDLEARALRPLLLAKIREWVGASLRIDPVVEIEEDKRRQLEALGYLESEEAD
jgi:arylsulfatase